MGGVIANILSSLLLLLSTPILIFGGFILVYFYHVQSFGVVSNLIASITISIFQIIHTGLCKTLFLMDLCVFLIVSCILNGISTYGCSELHSIILQQNFLSVNIGDGSIVGIPCKRNSSRKPFLIVGHRRSTQ